MHGLSRLMYMLTRKSRFLAGSVLKLMNSQVSPLLLCFEVLVFNLNILIHRPRFASHGSSKTIKHCKKRSPARPPCSAPSTRGYSIACDKDRARPNMWSTLPTYPVARRPVSTIRLRWAGRSGLSSCSRCTAKWCRPWCRIRMISAQRIDRYSDMKLKLDVR